MRIILIMLAIFIYSSTYSQEIILDFANDVTRDTTIKNHTLHFSFLVNDRDEVLSATCNNTLYLLNDSFKITGATIYPDRTDSEIVIPNIHFKKSLKLDKCYFKDNLLLTNVRVDSDLFIDNSAVSKKLNVLKTELYGLRFYNNHVRDLCTYDSCNIKNALFINNVLDSDLSFKHTHFNYELQIIGNNIKDIDFTMASMPSFTAFISNKIEGTVDLQDINVSRTESDSNMSFEYPPYDLMIYNCDLSKFKINYAYFNLRLLKPIIDEDAERSGKYFEPLLRDEGIALYEALLKNFKERGQLESYEKLDVEYQRYKWQTRHWSVSWIGTISDAWWRFGYSKERIFFWTLVLLLLFTIPTFRYINYLNNHVYTIPTIVLSPNAPFPKRLWYSIVYTSSIFLRLTLKIENMKFLYGRAAITGTIYVMVVYSAGIICLGYIANFILN